MQMQPKLIVKGLFTFILSSLSISFYANTRWFLAIITNAKTLLRFLNSFNGKSMLNITIVVKMLKFTQINCNDCFISRMPVTPYARLKYYGTLSFVNQIAVCNVWSFISKNNRQFFALRHTPHRNIIIYNDVFFLISIYGSWTHLSLLFIANIYPLKILQEHFYRCLKSAVGRKR